MFKSAQVTHHTNQYELPSDVARHGFKRRDSSAYGQHVPHTHEKLQAIKEAELRRREDKLKISKEEEELRDIETTEQHQQLRRFSWRRRRRRGESFLHSAEKACVHVATKVASGVEHVAEAVGSAIAGDFNWDTSKTLASFG